MGSISDSDQVHVLFFPLMAPGHMLPALDIAELFAARGAKCTVVTTAGNAAFFAKSEKIDLKLIDFPSGEVGLPEGVENLDAVATPDGASKFFLGLELLRAPVEKLVGELRPHALFADMFFPWANDVASNHGIPRIMFQGTSFFAMCAIDCLETQKPYEGVSSDSEQFVLAGLPGEIKMTRLQIPDQIRLGLETNFTRFWSGALESAKTCYGTIVNSVYELEPDYADHYRTVLGRRAWHVGPVSLQRTRIGKVNESDPLKWLDSKKPNSVVYVCFGTTTSFSGDQLREIAAGLENSGQNFIWVVKKHDKTEENWLAEGYEDRVGAGGQGLIVRGWAPQVEILSHVAVSAFVTHCGWNSTLEGLTAGVALVTWPVFAEQFYNEKLVTEVLGVGVGVGARRWVRYVGDFVKREALEKAVIEVMVGERAEDLRSRAKKVGEMAKRAVEVGGSSYSELGTLLHELRTFRDKTAPF